MYSEVCVHLAYGTYQTPKTFFASEISSKIVSADSHNLDNMQRPHGLQSVYMDRLYQSKHKTT